MEALMNKAFKQVWNTVTTAVVVLAVILALLLVGIRLLGFQVYTVLSGSMEPTYQTGSIIYVRKADYRTLRPGDTISFMVNETTVVTHRIIQIEQDETEADTLWFHTKGDANDSTDANPVHYRNVLGKAVFSIPYLGYVANYIQTPPGVYVTIGIVTLMLVLSFLPERKKKKEQPQA